MTAHLTETKWWNDLCEGIFGARKGGARIIIDAEDASTGVGKTGLAVYLARVLSRAFGYDLQEDDLTLSGREYLNRWRDHPGADQPSVIVLDELAGAGAGDARRAMSTQNVELGRSWQLMRKKRIVSIVTLPHWSDADKKMRRFADFRLWCRKQPIGYFRPYRVGTTFDAGDVSTTGYDDVNKIGFPNMDANDDPYYAMLSEKKDELLDSEYFDADELADDPEEEMEEEEDDELPKEAQVALAVEMRKRGLSYEKIAADERITYSESWVGNQLREKMDAEVAAP